MSLAEPSFVDRHAVADAFLGNQLARLVDQIVDQGDALLRARGLAFNSTAASTMLYLSERDGAAAADVARALGLPHQLATQRLDGLVALGLVERVADPDDRRRKFLRLTDKGRGQARRLRAALDDAAAAFRGLFQEIGADAYHVARDVSAALVRAPLAARIEAAKDPLSSTHAAPTHTAPTHAAPSADAAATRRPRS